MKLPHAGDPLGDAEGALRKGQVYAILVEQGVSVIPENQGVILKKGELIWYQELPEVVGGLMIKKLCEFFGINASLFETVQNSVSD